MLRDKAPVWITFIVGAFMVSKFFLNVPQVTKVAGELEQWCLIIVGISIVLGVVNILRVNLKVVANRGRDWGYKLALIVSMLGMTAVGIVELIVRKSIAGESVFQYLYRNVYTPLSATMFSLLAFFIASAAFRAFRARNFRAAVLLVAGAIVMIGRVPLGATIHPILPKLADWIMAYPNAAGQRGMVIGAALGVVATGLRVIFGIERPYLRGN
jgi:uncharacterized membrane protein (UPF0136 family)